MIASVGTTAFVVPFLGSCFNRTLGFCIAALISIGIVTLVVRLFREDTTGGDDFMAATQILVLGPAALICTASFAGAAIAPRRKKAQGRHL